MEVELKSSSFSQQKMASQKPRGTRLDVSLGCIKLRGSRNYTPYPLSVYPDEIYDDIVARGLRSDGLSTKLGIKNNKDLIGGLVSGLLIDDSRHQEVMTHFNEKRQRSSATKNIFSTMTRDELEMIRKEVFPTIVEGPAKNLLLKKLRKNDREKVEAALHVLDDVQETIKCLINTTEHFSTHNFLTRNFFLDIFVSTCEFIANLLIQSQQDEPRVAKKPTRQCGDRPPPPTTTNSTTVVVSSKDSTEEQMSNKDWLPVEFLQSGEDCGGKKKEKLLVLKPVSDNTVSNETPSMIIENPGMVVVECDGFNHESSTINLPMSFISPPKKNEEVIEDGIFCIDHQRGDDDVDKFSSGFYLCSGGNTSDDPRGVLSNDSYIPIEIESDSSIMLQNIQHEATDESMFPPLMKRQKHNNDHHLYNLD